MVPASYARGPLTEAIAAFWDVLIPGQPGEWPAASQAIEDQQDVVLEASDGAWLQAEAGALIKLSPQTRPTTMQRLEQDQPDRFCRVVAAFYAAYYTSPAVHDVVVRLSNAGPRESSPCFDSGLLDHVTRTQAGHRRI